MVLFFTYQPKGFPMKTELIGNRVRITGCRATVNNTKSFANDVHCPIYRMGRTAEKLKPEFGYYFLLRTL